MILYQMSDDRCILCVMMYKLYKRVVNETSQEMFLVDKKFIGLYYKLKF